MTTQKLVRLAMLLAVSVLLNYLEYTFINLAWVAPGVKLGLANSVGLVVLYLYDDAEFIQIGLLRVILVALLRTGFGSAFLISVGGWLLSTALVLVLKHVGKVSIFGLSVGSAFFHGVGQLLVVAFLYQSIFMINYLPFLTLASSISGFLLAMATGQLLRRLKWML